MADDDKSILAKYRPELTPKPGDVLTAPQPESTATPQAAPEQDNAEGGSLLEKHNPFPGEKIATPEVGLVGSVTRSAARSALPAAGGLAAAGAGATAGAELGLLGGPIAPFTVPAGAIIGGLGAMLLGSWATEKAQDWGIKQLPDSWQDTLGQTDRQQKLDEMVNPKATFIGGLLPYVLTMRPGGFARSALPPNATAIQRLMADPATKAVFAGGLMGGLELGQEAAQGDVNWAKVGIATGFGVIFNKPTRFGEKITGVGENAMQTMRERAQRSILEGRDRRAAARGEFTYEGTPDFGVPHDFTVAEAHDWNVMGPGVTEDTWMGSQQPSPEAKATARQGAQAEQEFFGASLPGDLHTLARSSHPELFEQHDELLRRRDTYERWIKELDETDRARREASPEATAAQTKIDEILGKVKGVEDRLTKRAAADLATARGALEEIRNPTAETRDMQTVRQRLVETNRSLWRLEPEVKAAYRRAADAGGFEVFEPPAAEAPVAPPAGSREAGPLPPEAGAEAATAPSIPAAGEAVAPPTSAATTAGELPFTAPLPIAEQKARIAADVKRQLLAAGRPETEAEAGGRVAAAKYATRADLFRGKLGSALELYEREGATIQGPPPKPPAPPTYEQKVATEREKVWADKKLMGRTRRGVVRNEDFVREVARRRVMRAEIGEEPARAAVDRGLPETAIDEVAKYYRRAEGETPQQAFDRAIDRWMDVTERNATLAERVMDEDTATYDLLKSLPGDPAIEEMYARLEEAYTGSKEIVDANDIPFGYEPTGEAARPGEEPGGKAAEGRQGEEAGGGPGRRGEVPGEQERELAQDRDELEQRKAGEGALGSITRDIKPLMRIAETGDASTFIHESGHQFADQMMRDGAHPDAPPELIADARTMWIESGGSRRKFADWERGDRSKPLRLTTEQHEKIAQWHEQYFRQGTAPSKELAGVFAQFRQWMMQIYEAIKSLGKPLSNEMQEVFDRWYAAEPERVPIAKESEYGPSIGDIWTADADEIPGPEALAGADRVSAESEQYAATLPPEVQDGLAAKVAEVEAAEAAAAKPGGEAAGGAAKAGEVGEGGGAAGPDTGRGAGGDESGAVSSGRSEAAAESNAGSEQRPGSAGAVESNPLAPTPATDFSLTDSPFLDKAGNIRRDVLNSTDDVWAAIKAAADANGDFVGARRGVVSPGQIMDLANVMGMSGANELVNRWVVGRAFNAEQMTALMLLLERSAGDVSAAMKKAATGSDADVLAYAETAARHRMVQETVSGATAEAGRALYSLRAFKGRFDDVNAAAQSATGKTLFQLRMEAKLGASLDTPGKVSKFLADAQKRSFGRMILEYWVNGLISGPATHMTYMVGNTLLAMQKAGPETAAAAAIGALRSAMGRTGERVRAGEVGAQFGAMVRGTPAALQAATEAARSGVTTLLPGEKGRPMMPFNEYEPLVVGKNATDADVTWKEASADLFGLMRGVVDGIQATGELLKAGGERGAPMVGLNYSPLGQIPDIAFRGVTVLPAGQILRLPSRGVAVIHSFYRSTNYSMEKAAGAYRTATEEGHQGQAFAARIADLRQNPGEERMEGYRRGATELTLMGQGGEFTQYLSRLTNSVVNLPFIGETQILKFIDPFVHISSNIIEQAILKRTPVGILSSEIRADLMGKNGNVAQDTTMARMLVGTAYALGFGTLAAQGYVSGSGPTDRNQAAMWRLAGNQAHSVRIGDTWYDAHRLGPMGMLLGVAADMYEVAHQANKGEFTEAASAFHHAIVQNVLDESFMRGPSDLIKAMEDPGRYGANWVRTMASSFVPFSVGLSQEARAMDPYSRQARNMVDAIKVKIPGLSEEVPPRIDIWGQPMPNKDVAFGASGVLAIYAQRMSTDPVNVAMVKLGMGPAPVQRKIRGIDLTDQQWVEYATLAGRMAKMRLDVIVNSPDFQRWPARAQHDAIQANITASRETARGAMMARYPDIIKKAMAAKAAGFDAKGENE